MTRLDRNHAVHALLATLLLSALPMLVACGDGAQKPSPTTVSKGSMQAIVTSSDLAVGPQRFAFVVLRDDVPVSADQITVRFFKIKDPKNPQLVGEGAVPFAPLGVPGLTTSGSDLTGVYYANVDCDEPGPC